jgi:hypothetical protein
MSNKRPSASFSLADRFDHGNFTILEVRVLKCVSHTKFYIELNAGKVGIIKSGHSSRVPGLIARRYKDGEPIDDLIPLFPGLIVGKGAASRKPNAARKALHFDEGAEVP